MTFFTQSAFAVVRSKVKGLIYFFPAEYTVKKTFRFPGNVVIPLTVQVMACKATDPFHICQVHTVNGFLQPDIERVMILPELRMTGKAERRAGTVWSARSVIFRFMAGHA